MADRTAASMLCLRELVADLRYKPGWFFEVRDGAWSGPIDVRLVVTMRVIDSTTGGNIELLHTIEVPPGALVNKGADVRYWRRWLLEQVFAIERHEACEFFQLGDSKPFFPDHDHNPYTVRDTTPVEDDARWKTTRLRELAP